jgi:hypothetical protein
MRVAPVDRALIQGTISEQSRRTELAGYLVAAGYNLDRVARLAPAAGAN